MSILNSNSPIPLYAQLEEILRENIANDVWSENDLIPSENELSQQYGLSRMTVRSVIVRLVQEGLLYRVQGKGTFVSTKKIISQPLSRMGIRDQLDKMGYKNITKLIHKKEIPANRSVAKKLQIPINAPVYEIKRTRSVEGVPFSIHTSYMPKNICLGLIHANHDFETNQLCDILKDEYKIVLDKMVETVEIVQSSKVEAGILGLSQNYPLIHLENTIYNEFGQAIEYSSVLFRGDKIKIEIINTYNR